MMLRSVSSLALLVSLAASVAAQTPANDQSDRLREVLPADVAERVLAKIAEARGRGLPAAALERRALAHAARGAKADEIERSVAEQSQRMERASQVLEQARGRQASGDEVDAGAEAMRMGVDGALISELAKSAPSGRSLAVPLLVVGSLTDRGLPSDQALQRVQAQLEARATDSDLERMAADGAGKPSDAGRERGNTKRPEGAGRPGAAGPPAGVSGNAGAGARPTGPPASPKPPRP